MDNGIICSKQFINYLIAGEALRLRSYLTNRSDGLSVVDENVKALSGLCVELTEALASRKPVRDKAMLDFSRLTCQLINGGLLEGLPRGFADLSDIAEDYWRYHAHKDKNKDLCFSYIRIYQITSMVRVFDRDKRRDKILFEATEKNRKHFDLLKQIYMDPGITHKVLSEKLGMTPSMLSHRTGMLEESGVLFARRMGKNKYYSLSNLGLNLYKRLDAQNIEASKDFAWGPSRLQILSAILMILSERSPKYVFAGYNRNEVIALEVELDKWSDEDLIKKIKDYIMRDSNISVAEIATTKRMKTMLVPSGSSPRKLDTPFSNDLNDVLADAWKGDQ